jgi:hypothetical protein
MLQLLSFNLFSFERLIEDSIFTAAVSSQKKAQVYI